MKEYYRRHLPHINPISAIYFITFRLINSLPNMIIRKLMEEYDARKELVKLQKTDPRIRTVPDDFYRRYFEAFDTFLDNQRSANNWLREPEIAQIVADALHYRDGKVYTLICYTIMPNHVHMVIDVSRDDIPTYIAEGYKRNTSYSIVSSILHSLKLYTARECNKALHRSGEFWQGESYDHIVRNEKELSGIINYIVHNPVKARFVRDPKDWKFTYCKYIV